LILFPALAIWVVHQLRTLRIRGPGALEATMLAISIGGFFLSTVVAVLTRSRGRPFQPPDLPPSGEGPYSRATLRWKAWLAASVIVWSALAMTVFAVFPYDSTAAWALFCLVIAAGAVWFWTSLGSGVRR